MTNWTITSVTTEQVEVIAPVRTTTKYRLTKRGRIVKAILCAVGTVLAGVILANCLLDGLEAEGKIRDAQNAPYIKAMQEKEMNRSAQQNI